MTIARSWRKTSSASLSLIREVKRTLLEVGNHSFWSTCVTTMGERQWVGAAGVLAFLGTAPAAMAEQAVWPPHGYTRWNSQLAFRQLPLGHCVSYADHGCWRLVFIARSGCADGLYVTVNEFKGNVLVGDTLDSRDVVPRMTPVQLELDADVSGAKGRIAKVDCYQ